MGQRGGASFDQHFSQYKSSDLYYLIKIGLNYLYFLQYGSIDPFIKYYMIQLTYFHLNIIVQMIHLHLYILD